MQPLRRKTVNILSIEEQAFSLSRSTLQFAAEASYYTAMLPLAVKVREYDSSHAAPR